MGKIQFLNYIITKGYVRWDDIINKYNLEGDEEFVIEEYNIVLWRGISKEFKDLLTEQWKENKVAFVPVDVTTYQLGGISIGTGYPIGKSIPGGGYKEKRWFPTVISYKVL